MKKFAGILILLIVGTLISCPKPTGGSPSESATSPPVDPPGPKSKTWVVSTLAGDGTAGDRNGDETTTARFKNPTAVAVDSSGNVYVADRDNFRIRKITTSEEGVVSVSTLAGRNRGDLDGTGTAAQFNQPWGVAVDSSGNVYVADTNIHRIRKITPEGRVTTIAGGPIRQPGFADGDGTEARFRQPQGVAVDSSGNVYVADTYNNRIRKIAPATTGEGVIVSTLAGDGTYDYRDGAGTSAQFKYPTDVAVDASGNVYVADWNGHRIRKIAPASTGGGVIVSTLAGDGYVGGVSSIYRPAGVALDAEGNVYVAATGYGKIHKITSTGALSTIAGGGIAGFEDGVGTEAKFRAPPGVAVDSSGNIYIADQYNHAIRKIEYKVPD